MKSVILFTLFVACLMATQVQAFSWDKWGNGRKWGRNIANANDPLVINQKSKLERGKIS